MGDVTSGGVQDDAAANADIGGGGGDTSPSTPASLGFGGARGDIVARDTTPAPNVRPSRIAFNNQPMSGQGPVNTFSRYLQSFTDDVSDFLGGGTQTDDRGPSGADVGAVSVNDNQFNQGLASLSGVPDFVRIGGGTSSPTRNTGPFFPDPPTVNVDPTMAALRRGAPALIASNQRDVDQGMMMETRPNLFPQELGGGTIASPPRSGFQNIIDRPPQDFQNKIIGPLRTAPAGSPNDFQNIIYPIGVDRFAPIGDDKTPTSPTETTDFITPILPTPAAKPAVIDTLARPDANAEAAKLAALARSGSGGAKTQEELNLLQRLGRFLKGVGKSISNFEMNDIFEFLKGDPNYKGPSAAQQQLMGVPGPGPFVGGGVPSPSGGGGMAAPAKDPCPPGFRFDPTLQQCVPIIAPNTPTDTTTPTATPTTPAPGTSPPAAGGIANAYPFTLTPPIGAPVGNLPPVRLTT